MRTTISYLFAGLILIIVLLSINSCRKNFGLDEIDKLKFDSLHFEGSVAIPIVNSELTLANFIPSDDSTLWIEIDDSDLIHLRMYYKDFILIRMNEIFPIPYPAQNGFPVPADTIELQSDTSKLKVYNSMIGGKLFFKNPKVTFLIDNMIPIITFFKLDTLTFHNIDEEAITNTGHTSYPINAPTILGESAFSEVVIDTAEMPILPQVFSPVPQYISFYISAGSNTQQNLPFAVTGEEEMVIDVDIDLPLTARLDTIVMTDTTDFDWAGDTYEQIKTATLKIKFDNGFPVDGFAQIYFTDTTDTGDIGFIVDSVFTDIGNDVTEDGWHLESAETDAAGIVTISHESEIVIFLDQERIKYLKDSHASKIIIRGKLNSYDSHTGFFIKLLGSYKMGVQIAVKADFDASTNDDFN